MSPVDANPARLSEANLATLREARALHLRGRLGFLVGAGLSRDSGLPLWRDFNRALLASFLERRFARWEKKEARRYEESAGKVPFGYVDLVRHRLGDEFHHAVREALYGRVARIAPTEVHYALARLAVETDPPYPCIHTTNYDDLLEAAMSEVQGGAPTTPVHRRARAFADRPRVVHLHGYFPHNGGRADERALAHDLVVSDLDYHRLSNDHHDWTNRELLHLFDARSVLLLGMSMADWNVRRLLAYLAERRPPAAGREAARHPHFVVLEHRQLGAEDPASPLGGLDDGGLARLEEDEDRFWADEGVKILRVRSFFDLNYVLRRIRFGDRFDEGHEELRSAWARHAYGRLALDAPELQRLGTTALADARERLLAADLLPPRVEVDLFLPLPDGTCRLAFSSVGGEAVDAPREFVPRHDASDRSYTRALVLGKTVATTQPRAPGSWYRGIVAVPCFDARSGGIPVAAVRIRCSRRDAIAQPGEALAARLAMLKSRIHKEFQAIARRLEKLNAEA